ncbi:unnamed protein product [Heligmosomoides polygyrus]|uniref:RRP15-like protein n=1 Tax=Heligmosomoides polygyrus TaxID=6339 RepID=A0A3P8A5K4_HELPZ|nr:unnamed protein product [Heligmosomoides polygyrus]
MKKEENKVEKLHVAFEQCLGLFLKAASDKRVAACPTHVPQPALVEWEVKVEKKKVKLEKNKKKGRRYTGRRAMGRVDEADGDVELVERRCEAEKVREEHSACPWNPCEALKADVDDTRRSDVEDGQAKRALSGYVIVLFPKGQKWKKSEIKISTKYALPNASVGDEQMKELDAMEKKSKADNVVKAEQGLKRFMTKPGETSRERKEPRLLESRASTPPITTAIRNGRRAEKKSNGLRGPLCR